MSESNIEEIVEVPDKGSGSPVKPSGALPPSSNQSFWRKWLRALHWRHTHLSKPKWALLWTGVILAVAAAAYGSYLIYHHFKVASHNENSSPHISQPATEASHLTGVQVDPALNKRPVTGIMIENSLAARPQSGLEDAGVVFEAVAEGGITRFLALYQEAQPKYIGPIRSVRPYYLDFLMPFDGSIAHVGGAPQALRDIKSFGVKDLDQFANGSYYQRVSSRPAPHNVYTSMTELDKLNASKGFKASNFAGFLRKAEAPSNQPTAVKIDLNISSSLYSVHYKYDKTSNSYKRSEAGAAHTDEKSKTQLTPKVVIALVMTRGIAGDGQHTNYGTTGHGSMYVFQDGVLTKGTWYKSTRKSQFKFLDASGQQIALNPGQTWITIVDPGKVKYSAK